MHPTVGSPFDRVVPKGGAVLNSQFIPEGTDIGMTGWVIQRDKSVFGADAESFRPERWLEVDEAQTRIMDKSMLHVSTSLLVLWLQSLHYVQFGLGNRNCIGKVSS